VHAAAVLRLLKRLAAHRKRRAPGAVSDGGAPNGGDVCGKAALTARPAGGLVGVDCSVCMVRCCSSPHLQRLHGAPFA